MGMKMADMRLKNRKDDAVPASTLPIEGSDIWTRARGYLIITFISMALGIICNERSETPAALGAHCFRRYNRNQSSAPQIQYSDHCPNISLFSLTFTNTIRIMIKYLSKGDWLLPKA